MPKGSDVMLVQTVCAMFDCLASVLVSVAWKWWGPLGKGVLSPMASEGHGPQASRLLRTVLGRVMIAPVKPPSAALWNLA